MRRSPDLNVLSRRELFAIAGCVGLSAALAACTDGSVGGIQTGPLGNTGGNEPDDANDTPADAEHADAHQSTTDASVAPDAAMTGATCTGTATDVGAASTFVTNTPVYFSSGKFFVVRDAGGLYAVTAVCTHEGATCGLSGGDIHCPRHGALFKYDGTIISGPVSRELAHYSMCTLANGHIGVTKTTCAKAQRLVA
jgi:nitrite reductase/ring-hydroxylating ferredoxin subunit